MRSSKFCLAMCAVIAVLLLAATVTSYPASNPELMYNLQAMESMRQIPQWHCLRYRKFDLVRRCRNYRLGRKH